MCRVLREGTFVIGGGGGGGGGGLGILGVLSFLKS